MIFALALFSLLMQLNAGSEIGIKSALLNEYFPVDNGGTISKLPGKPFELYCQTDRRFKVCIWKWSEADCVYVDSVAGPDCPGSISRVDEAKCTIRIGSYDPIKHDGLWECALATTQDGIELYANLTLSMVSMARVVPKVAPKTVALNPGEVMDLSCSSVNQINLPSQGGQIFEWKIDGSSDFSNGQIIGESAINCQEIMGYGRRCHVESKLRYTAVQTNYMATCAGQQADSFGEVYRSADAGIELQISSLDESGVLSAGSKVAIAFAVIVPLLIVFFCILAFMCGWCCFKKNKAEKEGSGHHLVVHDLPQQSSEDALTREPFYVKPFDDKYQSVSPRYRQWPILPASQGESMANPMDIESPYDEFLNYKWEGFGRPHSTAGSLSSLDSFGHVDDLDLGRQLLMLAKSSNSSESEGSSSSEAEYSLPQYALTDSWV